MTFRTLFFSLYIFRFGYVHCDPHPGNVLVQKDPQGHVKIVLLDHGLYTVKEYEKQKKSRNTISIVCIILFFPFSNSRTTSASTTRTSG